MKPIHITLDINAADCYTPAMIRSISRERFGGVRWATAARKLAEERGGIHVLLADGRLKIWTRRTDGTVFSSAWWPGQYTFRDSVNSEGTTI